MDEDGALVVGLLGEAGSERALGQNVLSWLLEAEAELKVITPLCTQGNQVQKCTRPDLFLPVIRPTDSSLLVPAFQPISSF